MRIAYRLALAAALLVLLSGCSILGKKTDPPDPGTHITPAAYRAELNSWCRTTLAPRAKKVEGSLNRAIAAHSVPAVFAGLTSFIKVVIFYEGHFLATPVPAAMKARMGPVLEEMATAQPTFQNAAAAAHSHDLQALVIEARSVSALSVRYTKKLDAAGLSDCGSRLP